MSGASEKMLLCTNDAAPVVVVNPNGTSPFLLIGDHAGNVIPEALRSLGLGEAELSRHIGWDIGIAALGELLAADMDAVFVRQTYSRLVIDCNRDPAAHDSIPEVSDGTAIPGQQGAEQNGRAARIAAIHTPYQETIGREIARRAAAGQETILIALHSFTPRMAGLRPAVAAWQVGILHNGSNDAFAMRLLDRLRRRGNLTVGDNEPYRMDKIDYTIPRHAFAAGLPYAEIEVRQDLIGSPEGVRTWADLLADVLQSAKH